MGRFGHECGHAAGRNQKPLVSHGVDVQNQRSSANRDRYICYESILVIVRNHCRFEGDDRELDARRCLTKALKELMPESA